jgi:hypothetical protein
MCKESRIAAVFVKLKDDAICYWLMVIVSGLVFGMAGAFFNRAYLGAMPIKTPLFIRMVMGAISGTAYALILWGIGGAVLKIFGPKEYAHKVWGASFGCLLIWGLVIFGLGFFFHPKFTATLAQYGDAKEWLLYLKHVNEQYNAIPVVGFVKRGAYGVWALQLLFSAVGLRALKAPRTLRAIGLLLALMLLYFLLFEVYLAGLVR